MNSQNQWYIWSIWYLNCTIECDNTVPLSSTLDAIWPPFSPYSFVVNLEQMLKTIGYFVPADKPCFVLLTSLSNLTRVTDFSYGTFTLFDLMIRCVQNKFKSLRIFEVRTSYTALYMWLGLHISCPAHSVHLALLGTSVYLCGFLSRMWSTMVGGRHQGQHCRSVDESNNYVNSKIFL